MIEVRTDYHRTISFQKVSALSGILEAGELRMTFR